jgi:beta-galactosidase
VRSVEQGARSASSAKGDHDWPLRVPGLAFGGDYNPEQWPVEVQEEDVRLMQEAGVNLVSVAIFSWATIEPDEGRFEWDWLDATIDRLEAGGIRVALATATASPPPWLTARHPEILPRLADGTVLGQGSRQAYAVTHPLWRRYAVGMARRVAERYRDHPALALWHVDNEIGAHVPHDYSDSAADAFRTWLEVRYKTVPELNRAWGTAFWSQRYSTFADVEPPRAAPASLNPTQQLDFARFSSDALLAYLRDLCDAVRAVTPDVPVTTNFMIGQHKPLDYFAWAGEVDVVANDHYAISADDERHIELAFAADLTRGIAGGRPWILMEHSTSAVNWHPRNRAKGPGEMLRDSLTHVARGADAVMFFQWRQSVAGSEKFHSAMVPHAGTDTDLWRDVVRLGDAVRRLAPVRGSLVHADVAILFDYQAWWAGELDSHPTVDVAYLDRVTAYYRDLWLRGVTVDVVHPSADLSGYRVVIVPTLYLVSDEDAARIAAAARAGASVVVSYFSGIVDVDDHVRLGGYPGAFRDLLGVRVEEFYPLLAGETLPLDDGTRVSVWTEKLRLAGASAVRTLAAGVLAGTPAVTRNRAGNGTAWYQAARLDADGIHRLLGSVLDEAGVRHTVSPAPGVDVVVRRSDDAEYRFIINHTDRSTYVPGTGTDLLTGHRWTGAGHVPPGAVAVLQVDIP